MFTIFCISPEDNTVPFTTTANYLKAPPLGDYIFSKDKWTIVQFWETKCSYCRKEIPEIESFYKTKFIKEKLCALIVVSIQEIYEKVYSVEAPLIIDNGQKASQYIVFSIPTTFFIDEQHRIRDRLNGFVTA